MFIILYLYLCTFVCWVLPAQGLLGQGHEGVLAAVVHVVVGADEGAGQGEVESARLVGFAVGDERVVAVLVGWLSFHCLFHFKIIVIISFIRYFLCRFGYFAYLCTQKFIKV